MFTDPIRISVVGTGKMGFFHTRLLHRLGFLDSIVESDSDNNLEVGLHGGVYWKVNSSLGLFGEFQLDGNDGVFFGIELNTL